MKERMEGRSGELRVLQLLLRNLRRGVICFCFPHNVCSFSLRPLLHCSPLGHLFFFFLLSVLKLSSVCYFGKAIKRCQLIGNKALKADRSLLVKSSLHSQGIFLIYLTLLLSFPPFFHLFLYDRLSSTRDAVCVSSCPHLFSKLSL